MSVFVGNLSFEATEEDLWEAFEEFGQVASVTILKDTVSGKSGGFAFVEMPIRAEAKSAIIALNGTELKGRILRVEESRTGGR